MTFTVTSTNFSDGDHLATDHLLADSFGFGCAGANHSPALSWSGAPEGTRSFAVTCYDPDAPTGSGFWHRILLNLPTDTTELAVDAGTETGGRLPASALHVINDFGTVGYGGPCPPAGHGPHRYHFTVHALSVETLPVDTTTPQAVARFQLHAHTIATASIVGRCER
jgi:Raf kinase inhibitor-like YbhB/YbcL family protein